MNYANTPPWTEHIAPIQLISDKENSTELDPIIIDAPWLGTFSPGAGVDAISGKIAATAVESCKWTPPGGNISHTHIRLIQNEHDFGLEVENSLSGKFNIEDISLSSANSFVCKIAYSALTCTLVAEHHFESTGYEEGFNYKLSPTALAALKRSKDDFRKIYGDYFVAGARKKSRFLALYILKSNSFQEMVDFKREIGASIYNVLSADGSTKFNQAATNHNISISVDLIMEGVKEDYIPPEELTPQAIPKALSWFTQNMDGIPAYAKLIHYSALSTEISITVDVAPKIFLKLKSLYQLSRHIDGRYSSIPAKYQGVLGDLRNAFHYELELNQAVLAVNSKVLENISALGHKLKSALDAICARMDFYYEVSTLIASEPASKDKLIPNTAPDQKWVYGYTSAMRRDAAVVINSTQKKFHADASPFSVNECLLSLDENRDRLVVGWEVCSDRGYAHNGSWRKESGSILLSHQGAIHVQSEGSRGCDWVVTFYYVDSADYDFGH